MGVNRSGPGPATYSNVEFRARVVLDWRDMTFAHYGGMSVGSCGPDKSAGELTQLVQYARSLSSSSESVERSLVEQTRRLGGPAMMLSTADQSRFLAILVSLMQARHVVELGTFTGHATLAMAQRLPAGGKIITCDLVPRWTAIARDHWERAGVGDRIELRLQPAIDLLESLPAGEWIDMAFLDADKGSYVRYFDAIVPRLRPGGLLVADNVLAGGQVLEGGEHDSVGQAMDRFNRHVAADTRVEQVILTIADGLSLIRKRSDDVR